MKRILLSTCVLILLFSFQSYSQPTVSLSNKTALPCESVSYPIVASGFQNLVGAVTINILIDTNVIKCTGYTSGTLPVTLINYSDNPILISWSDVNGINLNGTMLTLHFKYKGGTSALDFTSACEITGTSLDPITVTWIDGGIAPKPTTTYYVDGAVSSSGNGLSWGTALQKISEATNKSLAAGDNVLIKPSLINYVDTVIIKSNGTEIVPLSFGVTVSDTNKITFPATTDLGCIDLVDYPGKFYAYLYRSWQGNNGVYKITQVNKALKYVIVEAAEFIPESGANSDSSLLQASIGFPVIYEKYSSNPQTERIILSSSGISGERAALHVGKPTSSGDFDVNAANYNIIDGIDITLADQVGVRIQNSKFNVYKNSRIYELDSIAFLISGNTAKPANNNFVLNNVIYNSKQKAIKIGIQGETSANNRANLNHIKGNEIYSTTGTNINYINAVDVCRYTGYTVIESNTFRNFKLKNTNRGAIEIKNNVRRVLAYSNFIKDIDRVNASNTHSIFYLQNYGNNNKVFNNVIVDSAGVDNDIFAFWVNGNGGYTAGLIAFNSVHKVDNGFKLESGATDVEFQIKNNIMNIEPTAPDHFNITGTGLFNVSYNCYSTVPVGYSGETGRIIADPLFLLPGSYQSPYALSLQSLSPCLNSGNPITGIATDFRKQARNTTNPSRGAIEQVVSSAYWTGEMNTNWHDYRNWDVKMVPLAVYHVIIPDRGNDPVISTGNVTVKSLQLISAAQIRINNARTLILTN